MSVQDEFWAYRACPRGVTGIESHRRLGLVHRLRGGDRRHACEDVAHPLESTTHHRSVALEDTTADQSPAPHNPDRPQDAAGIRRAAILEAAQALEDNYEVVGDFAADTRKTVQMCAFMLRRLAADSPAAASSSSES